MTDDQEEDEEITAGNALVMIARELRGIRKTLDALTYDPNGETTLGNIHTVLHDTLQTFGEDSETVSIAEHLQAAGHSDD